MLPFGIGIVSVSHTPNQAQLTPLSNIELWPVALLQHYSLYHGPANYTEVTFVNVTLVEAVPSDGGPAVV